jgi:hypothetical protein
MATTRSKPSAGSVEVADRYSTKSFAESLGDLVRMVQSDPVTNPLGRVNLSDFFRMVEGYDYNTLRKMLTGERNLRADAIEAIAATLSKQLGFTVEPRYFREYRVLEVVGMLENRPDMVDDVYDRLAGRYTREEGDDIPAGPAIRPYHKHEGR